MSDVWLAVVVVGAATVAFKAVGPVALGGRPLPRRVGAVVELLPPSVLAALVVTQALGGDRELVLDERLAGLAAAAVALAIRVPHRGGVVFRLPLIAVVSLAAAVTALVRAL